MQSELFDTAKRTGKKVEDIKSMMDKETWLIGQEIVDAGFADGMVDDEDFSKNPVRKSGASSWSHFPPFLRPMTAA